MSSAPSKVKSNSKIIIGKQLRELSLHPVHGCSVSMPDEDNMYLLHANIKVQDGPYKGLIMHVEMTFKEDYPFTCPSARIAPGLMVGKFQGQKYYEHIHTDENKICADLLGDYEQFFRSIDGGSVKAKSGWSPGCTISTVLMQLTQFFAEPDIPESRMPNGQAIKELRAHFDSFQCRCGHTTKEPLPPLYLPSSESSSSSSSENSQVTESKDETDELLKRLSCGISKLTLTDDPKMSLCVPVMLHRDKYGRLWSDILLETISYDSFMLQLQQAGVDKLDQYDQFKFKSPMGDYYNYVIPMYINEDHFRRSLDFIKNAISILKYGVEGRQEYDFSPEQVLEIIPNLINKVIVKLMKGDLFESNKAIDIYCYLVRLFQAFLDEYPELISAIDLEIDSFKLNDNNRNKKRLGDLGEFIFKIFFSKKYTFDDIKLLLLKEKFARQVFWTFKNNPTLQTKDYVVGNLDRLFKENIVGHRLAMFNIYSARIFCVPGMKEKFDQRFGHPPEDAVKDIKDKIKFLKDEKDGFKDYRTFMDALGMVGQGKLIKSNTDMINLLRDSIVLSNKQGYTKIKI